MGRSGKYRRSNKPGIMEAYLLYFAGGCFGVFFVSLVVAFLTKPYRQRKVRQSSNKEAAKKVGIIRARLVVHKLKLSGLERQTKWLNEQEAKRSSESKVSS